jgi:hypothetical protein
MPDAGAEYVALPIYHEELAKALNFTPSDLQENRAGRLSASQCSTQLQAVGRATAKSVVLLVLAVVCVAEAFAIGVTTVLALILLVLAAAFIAFVGIFAWFMPPIWRDAKAGTVSSTEGFVKAAERQTNIGTGSGRSVAFWSYYWVVDDLQWFWVPGKAYPVLTPARHRIYFLPSSRRIVAIEPI